MFIRGKAVADGAVSYLVDHFISTRVARMTFGIECATLFDVNNREHARRSGTVFTDARGDQRILNQFHVILTKVCNHHPNQPEDNLLKSLASRALVFQRQLHSVGHFGERFQINPEPSKKAPYWHTEASLIRSGLTSNLVSVLNKRMQG